MRMGLYEEQVQSQEEPELGGGGRVVQLELLKNVMTGSAGTSSCCCLVTPGLVSPGDPLLPHTQQVSD